VTYPQYENCTLCPRNCNINRNQGKLGFCKETNELRIASSCLHFGEEPPITCEHGSGTIFITGCNLHCAFCQNYQISQEGMGSAVSPAEFADMCLRLADNGAENINIVTGSHAIPSIADGLIQAKTRGLKIPVCWNTSAYETVESINMLKDLVDIWLPDMKTLNPMISDSVFGATDYPKIVKKAIRRMLEISPLKFENKTITTPAGAEAQKMLSGVIIRHLVLPGRMGDTKLVLDWLKNHADTKACISLMSQYTPVHPETTKLCDKKYAFTPQDLKKRETALSSFQNRLITNEEFSQIKDMIDTYEFEYLFYQELEDDTKWLPNFTKIQPFSYELAKPIWSWKTGFKV
jgi:putative pyruvate formate lyase activating enzyme